MAGRRAGRRAALPLSGRSIPSVGAHHLLGELPVRQFGLSKVKMKIATGELRSIKDGKYRRILPEWVDEYIRDQIDRHKAA